MTERKRSVPHRFPLIPVIVGVVVGVLVTVIGNIVFDFLPIAESRLVYVGGIPDTGAGS